MKPKSKTITQNSLKDHLEYYPNTGEFFWLHSKYRVDLVGKEAGHVDRCGYIRIKIGSTSYYSHRLAWLYMTGEYPLQYIDHRDGNRQNNRWNNLRQATHGQNAANSIGWSGRSLPKGVYQHSTSNNYFSVIVVDRTRHHLGSFKHPEEARAAYTAAAIKFRGEFAR